MKPNPADTLSFHRASVAQPKAQQISFTPDFQTTLAEHVYPGGTQGKAPWVITVKSEALLKELEKIPMGEKVPQDLAIKIVKEQSDDFSIRVYQEELPKQKILDGLDDSKPVYPCLKLIRNGNIQYNVREEKIGNKRYIRHENGRYLGPTIEHQCFFMGGREAQCFPSKEDLRNGCSF